MDSLANFPLKGRKTGFESFAPNLAEAEGGRLHALFGERLSLLEKQRRAYCAALVWLQIFGTFSFTVYKRNKRLQVSHCAFDLNVARHFLRGDQSNQTQSNFIDQIGKVVNQVTCYLKTIRVVQHAEYERDGVN